MTSSDSGHSTQLDSRSNSSMEVTNSAGGATYASVPGGSPPASQIRRHSALQGIFILSFLAWCLGGHLKWCIAIDQIQIVSVVEANYMKMLYSCLVSSTVVNNWNLAVECSPCQKCGMHVACRSSGAIHAAILYSLILACLLNSFSSALSYMYVLFGSSKSTLYRAFKLFDYILWCLVSEVLSNL